jgi:class 3 adenylate cyclase
MKETRTVEELLNQQGRKRAELAEIEREMQESKRPAAVVFADLSGSTAMKENRADQEWLNFIYQFIEAVSEAIRTAGGSLAKRIGDGLLGVFPDVASAETFLDLLDASPVLSSYTFTTAADFGEVYFFRFESHLAEDPYGSCVDRCARLLHLPMPGANLCGAGFFEASTCKGRFASAGNFSLKGFSEPQRVFFRLRNPSDTIDRFLGPILKVLNADPSAKSTYRYIPRTFRSADFAAVEGYARPFLLRELLNTPKLPISCHDFLERTRSVDNKDELQEYCGWLVEWKAPFDSYHRLSTGDLQAFFHSADHRSPSIMADLPPFMLDAVRQIRKGQKLRLRGIISGIDTLFIELNYVDLELCPQDAAKPPNPAERTGRNPS